MQNQGSKTIFLIEEDNDSRPILRETLKQHGYRVTLAVDEEDALDRVTNGCIKADLLLINLLRKSPEAILDVGRELTQKADLNIPIVVIASEFPSDLEGQDAQISETEYITYLAEANQLFDLLARLLPISATEKILSP
jgi:CheY-like chemotaxis protein